MPPKRIRVIKPPETESSEPHSKNDPNAPLIVHLADLHIRCGTLASSRYDEYNTVFVRIQAAIAHLIEQNATIRRPVYIVIAGDLFHSKLKIESPGLKLALQFLSGLGALAPTYVIAGNHDISQTNPDEPDLIHVLVNSGLLGPRVKYLDTTGYHKIDDSLGIGLVTIQDALQRGGTSGRATELPDFPPIPVSLTERAPYNIALFHGAVTGALLANNETLSSEADTYPTTWITAGGYKHVLLGDIHLTDVKGGSPLNTTAPQLPHTRLLSTHTPLSQDTPMIAYSGSPVQQNHGEPLFGHGFLIWDLALNVVHHYHVTNDYGFITVDIDNMRVKFAHKDWRVLDTSTDIMDTLPKKLNVRILSATEQHHNINDLKSLFATHEKEVIQVSRMELPKIDVNDDDSAQKSPEENMAKLAEFADDQVEPLTAMNTPTAWHTFVCEQHQGCANVPLEWFTNPDSLSLPTTVDEPGLTTLITTRNAKIDKKVREYMSEVGQQSSTTCAPFKLRHMEWDWILCYKAGNYFSFDSLAEKLIAISARNGMGKTSFLETICLALWGEGFPSRKTSVRGVGVGDVVCAHMPNDATPTTTIYLDTPSGTFRVRRNFSPSATVAQAAQVERVTINATTNIVSVVDATVAVGRPATNQWITNTIGPMEPFLMSSMITQNSDMDFFALKPQEQREMLDQALNINTSTAYHAVVKESKLAHSAAIDALKVLIDSMQYTSECPISTDDVERLEQEHDALTAANAELTSQVDGIKAELASLPVVKTRISEAEATVAPVTADEISQYLTLKAEYKALKVDAFLDDYEKPDPDDLQDMDMPDPAPMTLDAIEKELRSPAIATAEEDATEDVITSDEIEAARTEREQLLQNPVHKPPVLSTNPDADLAIQVPEPICDADIPPIPDITRIAYQDYMTHYSQYKLFIQDTPTNEPTHTEMSMLPTLLREIATLKTVDAVEPTKTSSGASHNWVWQGDGDAPINHDCAICRSRVSKPISPTLKKAHRKWELQHQIAALVAHHLQYYEEQYELIVTREAYEKREQERQEALTKLQRAQDTAKWREYQAKLARVNEVLKHAARVQARARKAELEEWQEQEITRRLIQAWRLQDQLGALESKIATSRATLTVKLAKIEADLAEKTHEHRRIGLELHDARRIQREHAAQTAQYASRTALLTSLQERTILINTTFEAFSNFKTWLYTHKVLPHIGRVANKIMTVMCEDRPLVLIGDATSNSGLTWYLQDGQVKAPIEKASGFQRFIAGIAIRLALGRLMQNGSSNECCQLFVDEGFVACDQENRSRVGEFLKALPHSHIFLVSHLEDVNQCAQRHVNIERPPFEQQSLLQVGRAVRSLMVSNSAPPEKKKRVVK